MDSKKEREERWTETMNTSLPDVALFFRAYAINKLDEDDIEWSPLVGIAEERLRARGIEYEPSFCC